MSEGRILVVDDEPQIQRFLKPALVAAGYELAPQTPPLPNLLVVLLGVIALSFLSGMTYGPVAALLSDMFPPAVRWDGKE